MRAHIRTTRKGMLVVARSAREVDDGGEFRLEKFQRMIEQYKYGVHDTSACAFYRSDPR